MNIAVNTRLLQKGKLEGVGWFTKETLARITRNHPEHHFIFIFDRPYDDEFIFSKNITPVVVSPLTQHPISWFVWFELRVPAILKKYKVDLFLSPDGYLSLNTRVRQITTIHDLNFAHRPDDLPWLTAKYYNYYFPRFAKKAHRIITVSYYSKEDIVRSYKLSDEKIDVAYNGINRLYTPITKESKQATKEKYTEGLDYFLFIGSLHPRKNICGLLCAYDAFRTSTGSTVKLIITGGEMSRTNDIWKIYNGLRYKKDVIFTGRIPSEELHFVLGAAFCLTFVPFFEGFGIPVIEAMSAGVPVICSNTTSLPEVGGDAVLYVDPFSMPQIRDAMIRILKEKKLQTQLIEKGFKQKEKFSWDKTAELVWGSVQICLNS